MTHASADVLKRDRIPKRAPAAGILSILAGGRGLFMKRWQ